MARLQAQLQKICLPAPALNGICQAACIISAPPICSVSSSLCPHLRAVPNMVDWPSMWRP